MVKGWQGESLRHSEASRKRRNIYVYEWVNGMPKKVAKFSSLSQMERWSPKLRANKKGVYEGKVGGHYWRAIEEL